MFCRMLALLCMSWTATAVHAESMSTLVALDGKEWLLATDPNGVGVVEKWWEAPCPEAKQAKVPGTIQEAFPGYAGYAWYWRDVRVSANPHDGGRYLLRFWDVDYVADVWVNGKHVGRHEGAQAHFVLDITDAIKSDATNRIAVRVLSVFGTVDGFVRGETPHGGYRDINVGGILDSVELLIVPQVRIDDLFVRADPVTGKVCIQAGVFNASSHTVSASVACAVTPSPSGEAVSAVTLDREIPPGASLIRAEMEVADPRLWQLNDPHLYRMTARIAAIGSDSVDESSTRFGFRDFRFKDGYFRLNGHRVFWRSAHSGADSPISIRLPYDRGLLRRDLLNLKAMGFNGIRFISTVGHRFQLDMCDEIGLMVYEESYASWMVAPSPQLGERQDRAVAGMILRDRNHPSVVMWGLLNETPDGPVFRHAVGQLSLVRDLDDSRVVMLGSGRFDTTQTMNGLEKWTPDNAFAPCLTHNPKSHAISCVTLWRPHEVALIPGVNGEYGAVRWTAPADGRYSVAARFRGTGTYTITNVHVLCGGKSVHESCINSEARGDVDQWESTVRVKQGETLDFAVGGHTAGGGEWYERWGNNTSLAVTISSASGQKYDLAAEFSKSNNPNGPWSYGWLAAGATPDAATFQLFTKSETEKCVSPGSLSNPGSDQWEDVLGDQHYYPRVPHRELEIARLRGIGINDNPMFLSEYGIGSGVNVPRMIRHYEQMGAASSERVGALTSMLARMTADWNRLKLDDTFADLEEFLQRSIAREASQKTLGINAIRSNPNIVAYGMTGCNDPLEFGEGLFTAFRELKPGTVDAVFEAFYPVRWSTFAEPPHGYRGSTVLLEAVLSNEDTAPPGVYPARLQVLDPNNRRVVDRSIAVTIPSRESGPEPPFAMPVFREEVPIDGPTGKYRFLVSFQQGVAATGGESVFFMTDPADMPPVNTEVTLWGVDPELLAWLKQRGIKISPYQAGETRSREVILVSSVPHAGGTPEAWRELVARIAHGSSAIFLSPEVFDKEGSQLGWLPLANKGSLAMVSEFTFPQVYPKDEWVKKHPLFDGLPCGGLMDYTFYREIIPDMRYGDFETPDEAVAGTFRTSHPGAYWCDAMLSVYRLGEGRFILNALRIRQTLGQDPTAERLLRNMIRYAARDSDKPPPPPQFSIEEIYKAIGY